jgi:hypothetical protein
MQNTQKLLFFSIFLFAIMACNKEEKKKQATEPQLTTLVYYQEIDDVILREDISKRIEIDLNDDRETDIAFELINLNDYNQAQHLTDSLAALVITPNVALLDNSTWGYADALDKDFLLTESMQWGVRENFVLGTNPAGEFNGKGIKYLGFRMNKGNFFYYGWVKLECSEDRDALHIISCGISEQANYLIQTGQK